MGVEPGARLGPEGGFLWRVVEVHGEILERVLVGVEGARGRIGPVDLLLVRGQNLLSGRARRLRRRWRHGSARVHHLIDPRTGRPVDGRIVSATVVATTAWLAEVYAKAVVVGSVTDFAELPSTVEVAAVTRTGTRLVSGGLREALLP